MTARWVDLIDAWGVATLNMAQLLLRMTVWGEITTISCPSHLMLIMQIENNCSEKPMW